MTSSVTTYGSGCSCSQEERAVFCGSNVGGLRRSSREQAEAALFVFPAELINALYARSRDFWSWVLLGNLHKTMTAANRYMQKCEKKKNNKYNKYYKKNPNENKTASLCLSGKQMALGFNKQWTGTGCFIIILYIFCISFFSETWCLQQILKNKRL